MKSRTFALLSLLAVAIMTYAFTLPAPAPLTAKEIAEIQAKTVWSGSGNILTATTPIVEIPARYPIFSIVQVSSYGKSNGYTFHESYSAFRFSRSMSIDVGKIMGKIFRYQKQKNSVSI